MAFPFGEGASPVEPVIVFDWDGTCVVPTAEGEEAFRRSYITDFALRFDLERARVENWFEVLLGTARADPNTYGWVIGGRIVAPTDVDVYVRMQVPAQMLLGELHPDKSIDDFREVLDDLYQAHYMKCAVQIREETVEVWKALRDAGIPFWVVTNSDPEKVRKRLTEIAPEVADWVAPLIRGFAKKFEVTDGPPCVPQHTYFGDLRRMIHLRKQRYYDVLTTILTESGVAWSGLRVIGDIAELDLGLPVEMGAYGLLIRGPNTPQYELAWAEAHPRVQIINNLREVLTALGR